MFGLIRRQGLTRQVSYSRRLLQSSYSTNATKENTTTNASPSKEANAPFLNDILAKIARIDKTIAAKKAELQQVPAKGQQTKKRSVNARNQQGQQKDNTESKKSRTQKNQKDASTKPKEQVYRSEQSPQETRIKVADHPLFANKFRARDQKEREVERNEPLKPRGPRRPRGQQTSQRPNQSQQAGESRPPRQQRARRQRQNTSFKKTDGATAGARVASKQIKSATFAPEINATTFFYGKVPSVNINTLSRLASVHKLALLKLKYPYLLPRSVINNLPKRAPRFIASQSSFTTEIDPEYVAQKISTVVKGEAHLLPENVGGKVWHDASAKSTILELNKNASVSYEDKVRIYEIANGIKNSKELFPNAAWNK